MTIEVIGGFVIRIRLLSIVGLALLAGCTLPPPKLSATVGTYVLKQGNQAKIGLALFSSFDPSRSIPKKGFEIKVSGPGGFEATRAYPDGKLSDWFADPDKAVSAGEYTLSATVDEQQYQFKPVLDLSSQLATPEPKLGPLPTRVEVSLNWQEVSSAKIYYVTLYKLVSNQPLKLDLVDQVYTKVLNHTFKGLNLENGAIYFAAVGALSLDPNIGYANLKDIPFNASYGQTNTFSFSATGALQLLGEAPLNVQILQEAR